MVRKVSQKPGKNDALCNGKTFGRLSLAITQKVKHVPEAFVKSDEGILRLDGGCGSWLLLIALKRGRLSWFASRIPRDCR